MACVTSTPYGCTITRPDKQQQISLSRAEWNGLASVRGKISACLADPHRDVPSPQHWDLPHDGSRPPHTVVRVNPSIWNGECYVNIRVYVNGTPTKQGVTLSASNWFGVESGLGFSVEAQLARQVYISMLSEMGVRAAKAKCEGCARDRPSQRDHECLTITRGLFASLPPVNPQDFVVELAILSRERGHKLERPMECYDACSNFLRDDIVAELTAADLAM